MIAIILTIVIMATMIWGTIKYLKGCAYYYYNPVNALDTPFAFVSIALPLLSIAFASALGKAGTGNKWFFFIIQMIIILSAVIVGIILIWYAIRRIYNRTGSWKFAVASYFVEILVVYVGLATVGIFILGAYYLVDKMVKKQ